MRIIKDAYLGTVTIIIGAASITLTIGEWSRMIARPEGN